MQIARVRAIRIPIGHRGRFTIALYFGNYFCGVSNKVQGRFFVYMATRENKSEIGNRANES
jgi:hypothetical protein